MIPFLLVAALIEDFTNMESPRRNWYKGTLNIPDFRDFLMGEIPGTAWNQDTQTDAKKAARKRA